MYCRGSSVVERKPEELCVVGSIPTPGTILCFHVHIIKTLASIDLLHYYDEIKGSRV